MFEAYRIGIRLSLIDHVSSGIASMSQHFLLAHKNVDSLQSKLNELKKSMFFGGAVAGVGFAGLAVLKGPYEDAKKLAQAKANFETLNLSAFENSQVYATAAANSHKVLGTTITNNVKAIHDLHTAFGDLHHAINTSDQFAKFSVAARVANGGKEVEGLTYNAVKALEHRGGKVINDPTAFNSELGMMSQVFFGSKGKVSPSDYFHASQTGKMAYSLFDKEYLYGQFAAYMQAKTGSTAGTASMTAFSSLVGGHMDNKAKGFLAQLGMLQIGVSKKQVQLINHSIDKLDLPESEKKKLRKAEMPLTGGLKDTYLDKFVHRPDLFAWEDLAPAIRRVFGKNMSDEAVATMIAKNFNRSTGDDLGELIINHQKFIKDAEIFKKSMNFGFAYNHYMKTPEGAEEAAGAAWKNISTLIGTVYLPKITDGLIKFAGALDSTGQWIEKNKSTVEGLTWAFIGLSGAMAIGGTIWALGGAFKFLNLAMTLPELAAAGGAAGIAGSIGILGKAIAGLGIAGAVGYGIGTLINKSIEGTEAANWIGRQVARGVAITTGDDEAYRALYEEQRYKSHLERLNAPEGFVSGQIRKPKVVSSSYEDMAKPSRYVASARASSTPSAINNTIVMPNGDVLAKVVTTHQVKALSRPNSTIGGFDGGMALQFPGMNTTR